ncbi:MAG: hypothetical protein IPO94_18835 [Saprospiraceae bacterium]|nr:hypothetical protein [Saprospiraceae bacterium]
MHSYLFFTERKVDIPVVSVSGILVKIQRQSCSTTASRLYNWGSGCNVTGDTVPNPAVYSKLYQCPLYSNYNIY